VVQRLSTESAEDFIKRKHDAALELIDEAVKANALIMPIVTVDGMQTGTGMPVIEIKFTINERLLHSFRQGKAQ